MVKNEKDKVLERQLPGRNFGPGVTTMFEIAQSNGASVGLPQPEPADVIVSERDKNILANAIPANRIEQTFAIKAKKPFEIKRGMILKHTPSGKKVTILKTNIGVSGSGKIQHLACVFGSSEPIKVKEENLCPI